MTSNKVYFFAHYETELSKHDRHGIATIEDKNLTLEAFKDWLETQRKEIEEKTNGLAVIVNCKIIKP
jgi:hypothetical protein